MAKEKEVKERKRGRATGIEQADIRRGDTKMPNVALCIRCVKYSL